ADKGHRRSTAPRVDSLPLTARRDGARTGPPPRLLRRGRAPHHVHPVPTTERVSSADDVASLPCRAARVKIHSNGTGTGSGWVCESISQSEDPITGDDVALNDDDMTTAYGEGGEGPADSGAGAGTPGVHDGGADSGADSGAEGPADAGAGGGAPGEHDGGADGGAEGPADAGAGGGLPGQHDGGAD